MSVPVFWLGILLIQVFSFGLGWVPIVGADPVAGLILPVITLAVPISAPLAQILVRSIDDVRLQPFVTVVRAKGASPSWVLWSSVARNALLPTLTIAGVLFGELIGGAVVTETVFGRAGDRPGDRAGRREPGHPGAPGHRRAGRADVRRRQPRRRPALPGARPAAAHAARARPAPASTPALQEATA